MSAAPPARTVGLIGNFGTGNLGNEASLEAMHRFLRAARPHDRIVCVCPEPEVAAREHRMPALPMYWSGFRTPWARALNRALLKLPGKAMDFLLTLRRVGRFDILIVPGTGIFCDFMDSPNGMPYRLFKWSVAARMRGVPTAFASVGAEPVRNPASRRLLMAAARLAAYRSYRDDISRRCMADAGIDVSADGVFPDLAFGLPRGRPAGRVDPDVVCVGVMDYRGWDGHGPQGDEVYAAHIARVRRLVEGLLDRGRRVRLVIGQESDRRAVADVREAVAAARPGLEDGRLTAEPAATLLELMDQMRDAGAVVATRFHNIVCAMMAGRPAVSFGYSPKNAALMEDFGLGAFCQDVEAADPDALLDLVDRVMDEGHEAAIGRRLEGYDAALRVQGTQLLALLTPNGRPRRR